MLLFFRETWVKISLYKNNQVLFCELIWEIMRRGIFRKCTRLNWFLIQIRKLRVWEDLDSVTWNIIRQHISIGKWKFMDFCRWSFFVLAFLPYSYSDIFGGFKLLSQSKTTKQLKCLLFHTIAHTGTWLVAKILTGKINNFLQTLLLERG